MKRGEDRLQCHSQRFLIKCLQLRPTWDERPNEENFDWQVSYDVLSKTLNCSTDEPKGFKTFENTMGNLDPETAAWNLL